MNRDQREQADDRTPIREAAPKRLKDMKPGQPVGSDEAGDVSIQNADNPMQVREDVLNTSDSSGLHAEDEAKGKTIKEQLKRGATEVQPMD